MDKMLERKLQELREQLSSMRVAYEEKRSQISDVESSLREQRKGGQSRQEQLGECRLTQQRIEMDRVRIIDQIEERYDLHILSVLSDYHALGMPGEEQIAQKEMLNNMSVEEQSASLPGRFSRWLTADLRRTCSIACREACRALADRTTRVRMVSAVVLLLWSHCSSEERTAPSTWARTSGSLSRSLVCPWN